MDSGSVLVLVLADQEEQSNIILWLKATFCEPSIKFKYFIDILLVRTKYIKRHVQRERDK